MRRLLSLSALVLGLCLASTSFAADADTGTVKGSVVDASGKGVAGATVSLYAVAPKAQGPSKAATINQLKGGKKDGGAAKPAAVKEATTDADGKYEIKDVPVGKYRVEAKGTEGTGKAKEPITVTAGQTTEVPAITLAPKTGKKKG